MKTRWLIMLVCLAGILNPGLFRASGELEVSAGVNIHAATDFYKPLTPLGTWVEVGAHGRCWHPAGVAAGWRPYCNGYWEWTDAGWYLVSDEPWAWACYHYGSWIHDSNYGWVWVQPPHPAAPPVVPRGNPVPNQKGPDKDKDKHKDDVQRQTKFQNILAQKREDQWEAQDG